MRQIIFIVAGCAFIFRSSGARPLKVWARTSRTREEISRKPCQKTRAAVSGRGTCQRLWPYRHLIPLSVKVKYAGKIYRVDVCIVGAGPAGMILGLCWPTRASRSSFLNPSTISSVNTAARSSCRAFIQMMRQIGLLSCLEKYPHLKLKNFELHYKDKILANLDFSGICPEAPFALWMPQTVMLNALREKAATYPNFQLLFGVTVRDVTREGEKIVGVMATRRAEQFEVRARVTVGADGRAFRGAQDRRVQDGIRRL